MTYKELRLPQTADPIEQLAYDKLIMTVGYALVSAKGSRKVDRQRLFWIVMKGQTSRNLINVVKTIKELEKFIKENKWNG